MTTLASCQKNELPNVASAQTEFSTQREYKSNLNLEINGLEKLGSGVHNLA